MSTNPAIVMSGLSKAYGNFWALRGVDLAIERGEIFGFLGPNGSGKTTTIRCLLDLIRPSSGTIRVLDIDPQANPLAVRAQVGYLPGELRLEDNNTAEAILRYFNDLRGGKADWRFVRRLAERLDLALNVPIKNFSKGNKQKVGVVQALMHMPAVLLLDEPTSGLDPLMQQEVLKLVVEARNDGATVFFSSHILSEVQDIAARVAILRRGQVVEIAETSQLINRSLRRVHVRFKQPIDGKSLVLIPGITILKREERSMLLQVEGEMDGLIKWLSKYSIREFDTERPSLEEIFLAYYESDGKHT